MGKEVRYFKERLRAGLINFFIGDALGAPVEALHYLLIDKLYGKYGVKGLVKPSKNHPASSLRPWEITDDTETLLLVIETVYKYKYPKIQDYVKELISWAKERDILSKYYYGKSTKQAVSKLLKGASPEESGIEGDTNGGPVRSVVAGIINPGNPHYAYKDAILICKPTHNTSVALSAAALLASVTSLIMYGVEFENAMRRALKYASYGFKSGYLTSAPSVKDRLMLAIKVVNRVRDTYRAARKLHDLIGPGFHAAEGVPIALALALKLKNDPEEAILAALNMGGDTDTIAALAGFLTGIYSMRIANKVWAKEVLARNKLNVKDLIEKLRAVTISRGYILK